MEKVRGRQGREEKETHTAEKTTGRYGEAILKSPDPYTKRQRT